MMPKKLLSRTIGLSLVLVGCSSATSEGDGGAGAASAGGFGGGVESGGGAEAGGGVPNVLYVHTGDTLYGGDPSVEPLALAEIGRFDCVPTWSKQTSVGLSDIAVDGDGGLWALWVSSGGHGSVVGAVVGPLTVTPTGAVHCEQGVPLSRPLALVGMTFAPKGLLAADQQVLVATGDAGEVWSIDSRGVVAPRGRLGVVPADDGRGHVYDASHVGVAWTASDLALFDNGGNSLGYAIARDCDAVGCGPFDTLLEIDVAALATATDPSVVSRVRGQIRRRAGCVDAEAGYGGIGGVAAWQGKVYGFAGSRAIEIDPGDGSGCAIDVHAQLPEGGAWGGAGVRTSAPVLAPKP